MKKAHLTTSTMLIHYLAKEKKENREIVTNEGYTVINGKVYLLYYIDGELNAQFTRIKEANPPEKLYGFIPYYPETVEIIV